MSDWTDNWPAELKPDTKDLIDLIRRAAELLHNATARRGNADDGKWWTERDQWLRDAGVEEK